MNFRSRFFKHATTTSLTIAALAGLKASKYDGLTMNNAADLGQTIGITGALSYVSARLSGENVLSCLGGSLAGASLTILMASYYLMLYPKNPGTRVVVAGIATASLATLLDRYLTEENLPQLREQPLRRR